MAYNHQDWEPVVFRKKEAPSEKRLEKARATSNGMTKVDKALRADDREGFDLPKFDREYIQRVIAARVAKKWSQKDLASNMNMDLARIQRFEQGKEVYDGKFKDRLNRALALGKA